MRPVCAIGITTKALSATIATNDGFTAHKLPSLPLRTTLQTMKDVLH